MLEQNLSIKNSWVPEKPKKPRFYYAILFGVLILYALIAYQYFGLGALTNLKSKVVGTFRWEDFFDQMPYIWCLKWWPYAFTHHLNPFITDYVWTPTGYNLAASPATLLSLSILTWPLQKLFGVLVVYNLLAIFTPALAAWTMFILCWWLIKRPVPAFLGGYLFGFSTYTVAHSQVVHFGLYAAIFLIPLIILIALKFLKHEIKPLIFIVLTTLLFTFFFLTISEVFVTFSFCYFLAFLLALLICIEDRERLKKLGLYTFLSYLLTAILTSPLLWYYFTDKINGPTTVPTVGLTNDLIGFLFPTSNFLISSANFLQNIHFHLGVDSYLGIPLLVLIFFAIRNWNIRICKLLIILFFIFLIISLGPLWIFNGHPVTSFFPNTIFYSLPIFKYALPMRYWLYSTFILALIAVVWIKDSSVYSWRTILVVISCLFIIPSYDRLNYGYSINQTNNPPFFVSQDLKKILTPGENILILPYSGKNSNGLDLWYQVESNFYFKMSQGFVGVFPLAVQTRIPHAWVSSIYIGLFGDQLSIIKIPEFIDYLKKHEIRDIVVLDSAYLEWQPILTELPLKSPVHIDGVRVYSVATNYI